MKKHLTTIGVITALLLSGTAGTLQVLDQPDKEYVLVDQTDYPTTDSESDNPITEGEKTAWFVKQVLYVKKDTSKVEISAGPGGRVPSDKFLLRENLIVRTQGQPGVGWFNVYDTLPPEFGDWIAYKMTPPTKIKK
jgi:hypothetical protein